MDGQQIYDNFQNGDGTSKLETMADQLMKLNTSYEDRAKSIKALQDSMASAWTGDASAAASAGAGPLKTALTDSATNFEATKTSMVGQSEVWNKTKNTVEPVPPAPEKPSGWGSALKGAIPIAGPIMVANDVKNYQSGVEAHNEASQRNVTAMTTYSAATSANSAGVPQDPTELSPSGAAIKLAPSTPNAVSGDLSGDAGSTHASSSSVPVSGPSTSSGPANAGAAPTLTGATSGTSNSVNVPGGPNGPVSSPPNLGGSNTTTPPTTVGTTPVGTSPTNTSGNTNRSRSGPTGLFGTPGGSSRTTTTTGGTGSTSNPYSTSQRAGSRLYGTGTGSGAGTGAGARGMGESAAGRAAGAEGAKSLGAGKGSGVGLGSNAAAAEAAAAKGAAGGGRAGAMGGAMGAGGRRGEGAEDEEHQRAEYLQENDPDEVFIGDLGKTAPPVIGE